MAEEVSGRTATRGVAIRRLGTEARITLRLPPEAVASAATALGLALDVPINRRAVSGVRSAARVGPDEWLICGPDGEREAMLRTLETALADRHHACVDVSHRNVAFELAGEHAEAVLNSGCPLDLSAAAFPSGSATRTVLGQVEIVLARLDDASHFRVECWRSFAGYVDDFLHEAAAEFAA
jgi:sarcosine oxidase subunit gamma